MPTAVNWEDLYWEHREAIVRYCGNYCKSQAEAEDITQDVFIKIQSKLSELDPQQSIKAYLYQTARNLCLNAIRDQQCHRKHEKFAWSKSFFATTTKIDIADHQPSPKSEIIQQEGREQLMQNLERLKSEQREAILLRYHDNMSRQEISEVLGCSLTKTKKLLLDGLKNLRQTYQP